MEFDFFILRIHDTFLWRRQEIESYNEVERQKGVFEAETTEVLLHFYGHLQNFVHYKAKYRTQ